MIFSFNTPNVANPPSSCLLSTFRSKSCLRWEDWEMGILRKTGEKWDHSESFQLPVLELITPSLSCSPSPIHPPFLSSLSQNSSSQSQTPYTAAAVVQPLNRVRLFVTPKDGSTPGFPVLHWLPEFVQTYVHRVSNAIQPSHPLLPPSPFAFNLSQHQGLFAYLRLHHF